MCMLVDIRSGEIGYGIILYVSLWFPLVKHFALSVVFTPYAASHMIGYRFHGVVDASCHRVSGVEYLVSFFLSYPMSLDIRELANWQGTGFRSTADEGRSGWF